MKKPEKNLKTQEVEKYIQSLSGKSPAIVNISRMVCDIDATWQPRRVDWNAHV